jgi:hypothetical protein
VHVGLWEVRVGHELSKDRKVVKDGWENGGFRHLAMGIEYEEKSSLWGR